MDEVSSKQPALLSLFDADLPNRPMVEGVLRGRLVGRVFVDASNRPGGAVVVSNYGWTFVGGKVRQDELDALVSKVRREQRVVLVCPAEGLLSLNLPPGATTQVERREFFDAIQAVVPPTPAGFHVQPMDEELLNKCQWGGEVQAICGSYQAFLKVGLGLCLMEHETIACEAYAAVAGDSAYEIGVVTHEAYRRRGLAVLACAKLMAACVARGYVTQWSCHQANAASIATAQKLGYRRERPYRFVFYQPQ